MPVQAQADRNVPPLAPGRARYNVLSSRQATWVYQSMESAALDGKIPRSSSQAADQIDPEVTAGRAEWLGLSEGGLFSFVGNYKRPLICEAIDNPGTATLTLVKRNFAQTDPDAGDYLVLSRTMPTSTPFVIAPGEYIKATAGSAPGKVGFLLRIDDKTIL